MTDQPDAAFIEYVVKQLVEKPDAVVITRTVDEMGVLIQLAVDPADMGRVIGKEGRTAKALRTLLRVLGAKNNSRVNLKIIEPDGREVSGGHDHDHHDAPVAEKHEDTEQPMPVVDDGGPAQPEVVEETPAASSSDDEQAMEVL
jgi:hypothetical protein